MESISNQNAESLYNWHKYFENLPIAELKKLNIATFFSGIGALEQALLRLKVEHEIKIACDNNPFVKKSYFENYPIAEDRWYDDIYEFIDRPKNHDNIDLLVGGSPCQSFSSVGKRRGLNDSRGNLVFAFIDTIEIIQPKVFILKM